MNSYAKVIVLGSPITKSNFKLHNKNGRAILPYNTGKSHDKYALYEEEIAYHARNQNPDIIFYESLIAVLKVYYKSEKRHPDTANITKSIFDGIEKSGLIVNDAQIRKIIVEEFYDKENPRFELELFGESDFSVSYSINKKESPSEKMLYSSLKKSNNSTIKPLKEKKEIKNNDNYVEKIVLINYFKEVIMENKYVFLGDSLIFGYGVKPKDNWVNKLKVNYNLNINNKGINGSTSTDMLFRFQNDVVEASPNILFLMAGTNDLLSNRPVSSIIKNIEIMLKEALSHNIKTYIGIPPNIIPQMANKLFMKCDTYDYCKENLILLRKELLNLCKLYSINYIDFYSITENTNKISNLYLDGIHFNPQGQELLFETAKKYFN